jgi:hypothetical protein
VGQSHKLFVVDVMEEHGFDYAYADAGGYFEYYNSIFHSRLFSDTSKICYSSPFLYFFLFPLFCEVGFES